MPSSLANILAQLRADHDEILALLRLYGEEPEPLVRKHLRSRACRAIRLHCTLEAGVFIPAVATASGQFSLLEKTGADYATVLGLINEMGGANVAGDRLAVLLAELKSFMDEHIASAESDEGFLSQAPRLALDWTAIERQMAGRRDGLNEMLDRSEEIGGS